MNLNKKEVSEHQHLVHCSSTIIFKSVKNIVLHKMPRPTATSWPAWQPVPQDEKSLLEGCHDEYSSSSSDVSTASAATTSNRFLLFQQRPSSGRWILVIGLAFLLSMGINVVLLVQKYTTDLDQLCARQTSLNCA